MLKEIQAAGIAGTQVFVFHGFRLPITLPPFRYLWNVEDGSYYPLFEPVTPAAFDDTGNISPQQPVEKRSSTYARLTAKIQKDDEDEDLLQEELDDK